ncbi:MAG: hypothetical protein NC548_05540 [Lachnospiraceae bacterium]|nr:hypothetical protein [Lachnospiraceae bacterium]
MRELTFLSDNASAQVRATLMARELSEPLSPIRNNYNTTLARLTDGIVVQCVEYAVNENTALQRKDAFTAARAIQQDFIANTPEIHSPGIGKEFGIKMAKRILDDLCPGRNPMDLGTETVKMSNDMNLSIVHRKGIELGELFKNLIDTETRIGEILTEHLSAVKSA